VAPAWVLFRGAHRGRRCPLVAPAAAVGAVRRLHCDARARGQAAQLTSFALLTAFRQAAASQITKRACRALPPDAALLVAAQVAPSGQRPPRSPPPGFLDRQASTSSAKVHPGRRRRAWEAPRSAAPRSARASALRELTSPRLFERSGRSPRSEFRGATWARASQGSRPARPAAEAKRRSLPGGAFAAPNGTRTADVELQQRAATRRPLA
jgi:hypothetical protein